MSDLDRASHPKEFPRIQSNAPEIIGFFPSAFECGESYAVMADSDGKLCTWFDGVSLSVRGEASSFEDESFRGDRDEIFSALEEGNIIPLSVPYRAPVEPYIAVRTEDELSKLVSPDMRERLAGRRGIEDEAGRVWIRCEQDGNPVNYWYHVTTLPYYEKYLSE